MKSNPPRDILPSSSMSIPATQHDQSRLYAKEPQYASYGTGNSMSAPVPTGQLRHSSTLPPLSSSQPPPPPSHSQNPQYPTAYQPPPSTMGPSAPYSPPQPVATMGSQGKLTHSATLPPGTRVNSKPVLQHAGTMPVQSGQYGRQRSFTQQPIPSSPVQSRQGSLSPVAQRTPPQPMAGLPGSGPFAFAPSTGQPVQTYTSSRTPSHQTAQYASAPQTYTSAPNTIPRSQSPVRSTSWVSQGGSQGRY